jgi:hypothetical protein
MALGALLTSGSSSFATEASETLAYQKQKGKVESNAYASFNFAFKLLKLSCRVPVAAASVLALLPARFAVISAGSAITIFVATPAATTVTSATTIAAAAAIAPAAIAAGSAIGSGPSFIDGQIAAAKFLSIELFDCRRRFLRCCHFDKTEAARAASHAVFHD